MRYDTGFWKGGGPDCQDQLLLDLMMTPDSPLAPTCLRHHRVAVRRGADGTCRTSPARRGGGCAEGERDTWIRSGLRLGRSQVGPGRSAGRGKGWAGRMGSRRGPGEKSQHEGTE